MKQTYKRLMAWGLAAVMAAMSGCGAPGNTESTANQTTAAKAEGPAGPPMQEAPAGPLEGSLAEGKVISGFRVDSLWDSGILHAQLIGFTHEKSGAKLVWVKNSDPELAFSISYHTPYIDETDTNHVFEHAIVASSEKYPSKDLFFDLVGKSYNTFINAFTYNTFTAYPISSESEEQFVRLMDAYMSCMVAPDILKNENIFKREALRYELDSPEDGIQMIGTVYSEDFGSLTSMSGEALNNMADALYPGQYASQSIGRAHRNYENLTYQAVRDTYDRYYHFDNSLIFLYGDLDYEKILAFLDREYLSKAEKQGTDLAAYEDPATEDGYVEQTVSVPAYEGDQTEHASQIDYGFSLEDKSWEDLTAWLVLTTVLNHENSSFHQNLKAQGIQNPVEAGVDLYSAKPYLQFSLYNGDPEQSQAFRAVVDETLSQIAEEGVDEGILRSVLKQEKTSNSLLRDQRNVGVNIFPNIVNYWTHTGSCDFYSVLEQTFNRVEGDSGQELFCRLAEEARQAGRRALVTNVPEPGLAESLIDQRDTWLAEMKASMSEEEIRQMIEDTRAFREWNQQEGSNSDFMIDPSSIPDEEPYTGFEKQEGDGVTYYLAPAEVEDAGSYQMYLDLGDFSGEEQMDLAFFRILAGNMGTREHSQEEILNQKSEYLNSFKTSFRYPEGEDAWPMLQLEWTTLTEDYEAGLSLVLEMLGSTDFTDIGRIRELLEREADSYDISRSSDKLSDARDLAAAYVYRDYAYQDAYRGQKFYHYLEDMKTRLEEDRSYGEALAGRLESVAEKLMKKGRLILACAAPEADLERIRTVSASLLEALPAKEVGETRITLPGTAQKRAVIVESSDQYSVAVGNCYQADGFSGTCVPFLMAAADRYTVPRLRFQMGAYSSGITFTAYMGSMLLYSYSDPNGAQTLDVFDGTADAIADMELTQEDLDGYILTAVSTAGMARGVLTRPLTAMENEITGRDSQRACQVVNDMKNAVVADQKAAADCVREILEQSGTATVGNEARLRADQDAYDQLVSYKAGEP